MDDGAPDVGSADPRRVRGEGPAAVEAFHAAALAAGGVDNGAPGPRGGEGYGYYAAFVLDPDGNNVEGGVRQ